MTIMIVQGPQVHAPSLSRELLGQLKQLALAAGRTVEVCTCTGLREFVARVRTARPHSTEFMVLAPGTLAQQSQLHPEAGLGDALDALDMPYVEVQDGEASLEPANASGAVATVVVNGDARTSYSIALGIALKRLAA
ncbi:hypothetical protein [Dyella choica]|uniref:3-dehydroquinate dehydratase n=1 Tax=Dyella choica TaxID=1927959 RepID=A0A3S0WTG1_9GAMM|nr:hypothetical protein [Dyella choica]RUL71080.1 hypothetical protein EKH80_19235 [Dyella choica]